MWTLGDKYHDSVLNFLRSRGPVGPGPEKFLDSSMELVKAGKAVLWLHRKYPTVFPDAMGKPHKMDGFV